MKKNILSSICLLIGIASAMTAQVKIGNNPNTINTNSLFEMESTNKGFLAPRMALNSLNSASPLTTPVPEGMLVFSIGGTLPDGFYAWTGSNWLSISTSASARNNFVLVKSASDLPAPAGGIITLVPGTLYQVNGPITLSSKINLNGCKIFGLDAVNDKLVYTGSSELFTGTNTGSIEFLTLTAASGNVFNINGGGAAENLVVENCYFIGSNSLGTIQGLNGTAYFSNNAYFYNANGITFQNDSIVLCYSLMWDGSNHNTYEAFTGKFNIIQILGGGRIANLSNTATALNISGVSSLTNGSLKTLLYEGTGTYVNGVFSNNWEVESIGLPTQKDDNASGNCYITSTTPTTFTLINIPTKILGTTVSTSLFRVTSTANNRLTYAGRKTHTAKIDCALSANSVGTNNFYTFYVAVNGIPLAASAQQIKLSTSTDQQSVVVICNVSLNPNDYVEVWVANNSNTQSITVTSLNLTIK